MWFTWTLIAYVACTIIAFLILAPIAKRSRQYITGTILFLLMIVPMWWFYIYWYIHPEWGNQMPRSHVRLTPKPPATKVQLNCD